MGSEKQIKDINIAIGNNENRTPKSISIYRIPTVDYDITTVYNNNIKGRSDDNLILIHKEEYSQQVIVPTWYKFMPRHQESIVKNDKKVINESNLINSISIEVNENGGNFLVAGVNVNATNSEDIKGYLYSINNQILVFEKSTLYNYINLVLGQTYTLSVIAIDKNGNIKTDSIQAETNNYIKARYFLIDVYDHLGGNCAVLNELQVYDISNSNLYSYSISMVYLSASSADWNNSNFWSKDNLYDGQIAYSSNAQGKVNATHFGISTSGTKNFARFIIDLGDEKEIGSVKIAIGNNENRTPNSVSVYSVSTLYYNQNTIKEKNVNIRNDNNISLLNKYEFTAVVTTPTWYSF